jgi:sugar phosphate isomerase/epimerase
VKLAVIGDEISQDLALVAETTAQLGFHGVEVRSVAETPPHELSDEQLAEIRGALDGAGLAVAGFAPPVFKRELPRTDDELAETQRLLISACAQAELLGAPHVRVFTFYRDGDPDPVTAADVVRNLLDGVRLAVPLVVETGTRTNSPTMKHVLTFLDHAGRDDIGILWDPGNSVFSGWCADPFPDEYELGRDLIRHVHVKDPDGTRRYVRLGDGSLDWPGILARLAEDGYDGYVSLETHWRPDRVLTPQERDNPWGEAFSRGGYAASVECMQRLHAWVKGIGVVRRG